MQKLQRGFPLVNIAVAAGNTRFIMAEGLAGLIGAYGSDEEDVEEMEEEEAGGQVTILGRSEEDEEMQGVDLSHLTSATARPEADTAATQQQQQQQAGPGPGPAQGPAQLREPGGEDQPPDAAEAVLEGRGAEPTEADAAAASILPPEILEPPAGECDTGLQAKVSMWLNVQRTRGRFINQELRGSRAYRNPEFFRKMVEHLEIDEYGSCFAPEVFDPHNLPKEDFIDALQKEWAAEEERRKAQRAATGRIEFHKSSSQPQLAPHAHNPLLPGLNPGVGLSGLALPGGGAAAAGGPAAAGAINPVAALAAAQLKAAQLAAGAAGVALPAAQSGAAKGGKWDAPRR